MFMCETGTRLKFGRFSSQSAINNFEGCTNWLNINQQRTVQGANTVDEYIKSYLILNVDNPYDAYPSSNAVWSAFSASFEVDGIFQYEKEYKIYLRRAFEEMHADNVQYMEIEAGVLADVCRGTLDNCNPLTQRENALLFKEVIEQFKQAHQGDTCGVGIIHGMYKGISTEQVNAELRDLSGLMFEFPETILATGMAGRENLDHTLAYHAESFINASATYPNLKYRHHAGETIWQGQPSDIDIIDAILLGTSRLGHSMAIAKHPEAKRLARERNIPVEVNPVSNQILTWIDDIRNHPAAILIQENFPIVISSDNAGTWNAGGLTYDFYATFMALAGKEMDMRLIKKLIFNSIDYSFLQNDARNECKNLVQRKWDAYMKNVTGIDPSNAAGSGITAYLLINIMTLALYFNIV